MVEVESTNLNLSRRFRLNTLIRLRWLAVIGQSASVVIVTYVIGFPLPELECGVLIACSAVLNVYFALRYPASHRLTLYPALTILTYDVLQLAGLLYLTGGLTNPFALLTAAATVISATLMPVRHTALFGALIVAIVTILAFYHLPLPWLPSAEFSVLRIYVAGVWFAVVSTILFTSIYAWRVADEARKLAATHELGTPLATIALVAREMERALADDFHHGDNARKSGRRR